MGETTQAALQRRPQTASAPDMPALTSAAVPIGAREAREAAAAPLAQRPPRGGDDARVDRADAPEPDARPDPEDAPLADDARLEQDAPTAEDAPIAAGPRRPLSRWIAVTIAIALLLVGAMDAVSTELALATGQAWEANPIVRWLQEQIGVYWIAPKMAVHGFLAFVVMRFPIPMTLLVMGALASVVFAVSLNNFDIYFDAIG